MKLLLANRDWDQCAEFANRILEVDGANILALEVCWCYMTDVLIWLRESKKSENVIFFENDDFFIYLVLNI